MFKPINNVSTPPKEPTLIWDGECGFCQYWVLVWKNKTGNRLKYKKFQDVHEYLSSIPLKEFKKASRLLETDGRVYSGPDSAYRSFLYFRSPIKFPHSWYHKYGFFKAFSDHTYNWIAKHRSFMFALTKLLRGSDPKKHKPLWLIWLLLLILLIYGLGVVLIP